jgi:hypothetical protein
MAASLRFLRCSCEASLAIRGYHNSGNTTTLRVSLAILAALFDRLGRYEPAATIAGLALSPFSASAVPEITTAITQGMLRATMQFECENVAARAFAPEIAAATTAHSPMFHQCNSPNLPAPSQ